MFKKEVKFDTGITADWIVPVGITFGKDKNAVAACELYVSQEAAEGGAKPVQQVYIEIAGLVSYDVFIEEINKALKPKEE